MCPPSNPCCNQGALCPPLRRGRRESPSYAEAIPRHKRISRSKIPADFTLLQRPGLKLLDGRLVQHWRIHTQQRIRHPHAVRLRVSGLRDGGVLRGARRRRRNPELGVGHVRVEPEVRRSGTTAHVRQHRLERHERRSAVQGARLRTGRHDPGPQSDAESVLHGHPRLRGAETGKLWAPSPQGVRVTRLGCRVAYEGLGSCILWL